jgi:hypothetical protein
MRFALILNPSPQGKGLTNPRKFFTPLPEGEGQGVRAEINVPE